MKSQVIYIKKPNKIEFKDEIIDTNNYQLLCKTLCTAISPGTELAAYKGDPHLREGVSYPRLVGYCNVSEIIKENKKYSKYKVGTRVLTFESHRSYFGINENNILSEIPMNVSNENAATTYLFHLGYQNIINCNLIAGSRLLVIGIGCLGLTTINMGGIAGCEVYGLTDNDISRQQAEKMGAKKVFNRFEIKNELNHENKIKFDSIIITSNNWEDVYIAMQLAPLRGKIGLLGFPGRDGELPKFNPFEPHYFYQKQLSFISTGMLPEENDNRNFLRFNEKDNLSYILSLFKNKKINHSNIISKTFHASKIKDAYDYLIKRDKGVITCLLDWS